MQGKNKVLQIEDNNRVYAFASFRAVAFRAGMYTTCPGRRWSAAANGPKLLLKEPYTNPQTLLKFSFCFLSESLGNFSWFK